MKIDSNRIAQIAEAAKVSFELADEIVNSWDSEEHIEWVNTAEIQEVASWMKAIIAAAEEAAN